MMILKAYKYRIYPNKDQKVLLAKHFGCARYIYNWALATKIESYRTTKKLENFISLGNKLPKLKEELTWLTEINSQSLQSSLKNVDNAFKRFFKEKKGFPKFKSKKTHRYSFHVPQHGKVNFEIETISVPKCGSIKAKIDRKFEGQIKTITVSQTPSGRYYASILVETNLEIPKKPSIKEKTTIGIDVGLKTYVTFSDGTKIGNPKFLKTSQKKLKFAQRLLSRKVKESKNREKQRIKVARLHEKIKNQREDFLHKLSYQLTHDNQVDTIVVEDLSIRNLMKNHKLAGAISDASWYKFFEMLKYKCEWYGKNLLQIGKFDPSSKLCTCGVINQELKLSDREWTCSSCGTKHDRDVLAAQNIKWFGLLRQNKIPMEDRESTPTETSGRKHGHRSRKLRTSCS